MKYLSLKEVVEHGYCVGCGLCASQSQAGYMMDTNIGTYIPALSKFSDIELKSAEKFCPFSKESDGEDRLAKSAFHEGNLGYLDGLGYYDKTFAGYAIEGSFRQQGSSAGLVNWLCSKLLEKGDVEGIIHVKENLSNTSAMYSYQVSSTLEELQSGAKSKYYPVHLSDLIKKIESSSKKSFAIIGLPCFIKGLRALSQQNPTIKEKLKFYIGIVCGHLKSKHYAEFLAWQVGIKPENLRLLDFRTKLKDRPASRYGFTAIPKHGSKDTWIVKPMSEVIGANWGHGLFKLKSCEYCDDIMAETADIVFGDAWLPEFVDDSQGTNVINSRSNYLTSLLQKEFEQGNIHLVELKPSKVLDSQRSGLNHRREGLQYRSSLDEINGKPFPKKRTLPNIDNVPEKRQLIYEYREFIRKVSHQSFLISKKTDDIELTLSFLRPIIKAYSKVVAPNLSKRVVNKVRREFDKYIRLFSKK